MPGCVGPIPSSTMNWLYNYGRATFSASTYYFYEMEVIVPDSQCYYEDYMSEKNPKPCKSIWHLPTMYTFAYLFLKANLLRYNLGYNLKCPFYMYSYIITTTLKLYIVPVILTCSLMPFVVSLSEDPGKH